MAELVIKISGDIKDYEKALDQASSETEGLSDSLSSIAQKSAIAFAALTAEIGLSVAAYKESEAVTNKLTSALKNQGIFSQALIKDYQDQATELQNLTGISDEAIVSAQTSIQAYLGQTAVTKELTTAIADFAVAQGVDLSTAAELVGKSIGSSTNALSRYGIAVDVTKSKGEKLDEVIQSLNSRYAGQAAAAGQGLGAINKLKEAFGDFQENLGKRFAPIIENISNKLIGFFQLLQKNEGLADLTVALLAGGAALTGFIATLSTLGVALIAAKAAFAALGITVGVALGPITLIAAGITAVGAAIGYLITQQGAAVKPTDALKNKIVDLTEKIEELEEASKRKSLLGGGAAQRARQELDIRKAELEETKRILRNIEAEEQLSEQRKLDIQKEAADKRTAELEAHEARQAEIKRVAREIDQLEFQNASTFLIESKKAELEALRQLDDENYEGNREIAEQRLAEAQARNSEVRAAEYAVQQERLAQQRATNDTFLKEQIKFGTAYATINKVMHSAVIQGSAQAFGELVALQQSNNATLKGIGKAAATAQIIFDTARGALAAYAGFVTALGPIGIPLGIAAAGAIVAYGAEQIGKVNAAADGGLITGPGGPTSDVIPAMLSNGELVVPARNFDEVVNAVASQRNGERTTQEQGPISQTIELVLSLKDNLMDFIDVQQNERDTLGLSLRVNPA